MCRDGIDGGVVGLDGGGVCVIVLVVGGGYGVGGGFWCVVWFWVVESFV